MKSNNKNLGNKGPGPKRRQKSNENFKKTFRVYF